MAEIQRQVSVKVPTTKPEGKSVELTLDGDEVEITTPISWGDPRVLVDKLIQAVEELARAKVQQRG